MRPSKEPEPPEIRCEQGATTDPGLAPVATIAQWIKEGPAWAVAVLGVLTEERRLRSVEHDCMAQHRAKGHIR